MSDYLSATPNSNVALYLSSKIESDDPLLDLDALPTEGEGSNEAAAVAACLRGLGSFSEVRCGVGGEKPVAFVCYTMRFSTSITKLRLVSRRAEVEELGRAMKSNPTMPLRELDLSGSVLNNINSVIWLAGGLRMLAGGLEKVSFANCLLTPKAVAFLLLRGLGANPRGNCLVSLDLSYNDCQQGGTEAVVQFLKKISTSSSPSGGFSTASPMRDSPAGVRSSTLSSRKKGNLKELRLNGCSLDMKTFLPVLSVLTGLEQLNIGENDMGGCSSLLVSALRERVFPISKLDLNSCALSPDEVLILFLFSLLIYIYIYIYILIYLNPFLQVSIITHAFLSSPRNSSPKFRLKMGNNLLSSSLFPSVPAGGGAWSLEVLDLSNSNLNNRLFSAIVRRLAAPDMRVRTLVLDNSLSSDCNGL